jgi:YD repeat-containing protein
LGGDGNPETLDTVTGPFGRTLSFSYAADGRISTLTDPAGAVYAYSYDAGGNLRSVRYPDDTPTEHADNPTRYYHYEDPNHVHALTGITDATGNRYATWAYDSSGRAILSEHAGGTGRVQLTYHPDGTTTVTETQGQVQTYQFHIDHGLAQIKQIDGGPCSACGEQSHALTYDTYGFIASRTDFNGNLTTYVHDPRGLELARTEAAGTPEARLITTEWHPEFRLPLIITAPGKVITFTYDPQGRLLSRHEEAVE